jgi:hypothetical protein
MKPGQVLAAMRRRTWHYCPVCEKRFSGIKKAVYCSNACRQKAKHRRRAQEGRIEVKIGKRKGRNGWTVDFYDPLGKRHQVSFATKREAETYLDKAPMRCATGENWHGEQRYPA